MKLTLDSNVWRQIVEPKEYLADPKIVKYQLINKLLKNGKIETFLSETIFTLEGIQRKDRKFFFGTYEAEFSFAEAFIGNEAHGMIFTVGPNLDSHPGNNPYLAKYLSKAVSLNIKIMKNLRTGGIVNPDIKKEYYENYPNNDIYAYTNLCGQIDREMDAAGCGMIQVQNIGEKYKGSGRHWFEGLDNAGADEDKAISSGIAEWADGDMVAMHIAYGHDYLITNDKAKNAGKTSVLSTGNVNWLKSKYDLEILDIDEFFNLLKSKRYCT